MRLEQVDMLQGLRHIRGVRRHGASCLSQVLKIGNECQKSNKEPLVGLNVGRFECACLLD